MEGTTPDSAADEPVDDGAVSRDIRDAILGPPLDAMYKAKAKSFGLSESDTAALHGALHEGLRPMRHIRDQIEGEVRDAINEELQGE